MYTVTTSFQYQVLRTLLLLAVTLLVAACGADEEPTSESSTGPETSNGGVASTGSVPSSVAKAIDRVTSKPMYKHSSGDLCPGPLDGRGSPWAVWQQDVRSRFHLQDVHRSDRP